MIRLRSSCSWSRRLRWFTSAMLTIVLTMMPIPPVYAQSVLKGIIANASELTQRARSRLNSVRSARSPRTPQGGGANRGMPAAPPRSASDSPRQPQTKTAREAQVAKVEINLQRDVQLQSGERMQLGAVPLDLDGNAIHGLAADWASDNPQVVSISNKGEAVAGIPGKAQITASAGSKKANVTITVTPPTANTAKASGNNAVDKVSGARKSPHNGSIIRTSKGSEQKSSGRFREYAHRGELTGSVMPQGSGRDPDSLHTARNAVGAPPNKTTPGAKTRAAATEGTETPGSSNFNFNVEAVSLPGRGLDVDVSAFYNARLWNRSDTFGTQMSYDMDQGWPAPGFRLGYGEVKKGCGTCRSFELVDPDGTRHQMLDPNVSPQAPSYNYDSADGTFIHLTTSANAQPITATYPDGTQVLYGAPDVYAPNTLTWYPSRITDRNGNMVQINYVGGTGPKISSIQDTLLRYVYFKYVGNDLVAVTAPGLTGQADRPVIRFYYQDITGLDQTTLFQAGITNNGPGTAHVIKYIYLPNSVETNDAHIGYRYDYSAYGMIYQIAQFRGMTISTPANDYTQAGTVNSEGTQAALTTYNYQGTPVNTTYGIADAPNYTTRTDDWAGRVSAQPVYTFSVPTTGVSTVTSPPPDNTVTETHTIVDPGQEDDGLISEVIIKQGTNVLSDTVYSWELGGDGVSMRLHKVQVSNDAATGDPNKTRATVFEYDDTNSPYNNIWKVHEYGFAPAATLGTELRRTETTYVNDPSYWNRRLIHLPLSVKVSDVVNNKVASQTNFAYDEAGRVNLTAPSDVGAMYTNPQNSARGDLTTVTQYADASNPGGPASPVSHSTNYDSTGNVTLATLDCCQQKSFTYSSGYYYAYPTSVTSGAGPTLTSSATYDSNTGLVTSTTDENLQVTANYFAVDSLRLSYVQRPDGSTTHFYYADGLIGNSLTNGLHYFINTSTQLDATRFVDSYRFFDGRGAVTQTFDNWTNANGWSTQDIEYDVMGRAYRSGNPYYCGGYGWVGINPTGLWTTKTFDNLGRVTRVDMPSGDSQSPTTANVQSAYAGTVTTVTDQAGKQRRQVIDALGRVARLDEPGTAGNLDANGVPVQSTAYEYDILDNLIHITQDAQQRYFKYDSLSRLTYERQVEQDAPWTTTDSVAGNNQWSRKIIYNSQSLVQDAYDARSINTHFVYDGLNRVSQISYSDSTPAAYYWYDSQALPNGAPVYNHGSANGRLVAMTYGGLTATTGNYFGYDQMGRVNVQRQVTGSNTYSLSYGYNVGGLLTSETYPAMGQTQSIGQGQYFYDEGGRLASVKNGVSVPYDDTFTYAPHGGLTSESFANGAVHSMAYNNALQASQIRLQQSAGGSELQRFDYSYGQVNQATGSVETTKNNGQIGRIDGYINNAKQWDQRYVYDSLGRLSTAAEYKQGDSGQLTWQAHYDYDRYGNRLQYQSNSNVGYIPVQSSDIDATRNRFISQSWAPVSYDAAGNMTGDGKFRGMNYTYDANSRMTQASRTDNSGQATTVYDCAGQRIQATAGGVTRQMVYDAFGQLIAEYRQGSLDKEYIYRGGQLLAVNDVGGAPTNLALNASASQSSTFYIMTPNRAVDGNTNGDFWGGNTSSATNYEYQPWWQVDLGSSQSIGTIQVWPRTDCCPEMTSNFYVLVSDNPFTSTDLNTTLAQPGVSSYYVSGYAGTPATVNVNRTGRYVRVQKSDSQYLVLGEVQVWSSSGSGGLEYVLQDLQGSTRAVMSGSQIVARYDQMPFGESISAGTGLRSTTQGYSVTQDVRHRYASTEKDDATGLDHTWWRKYESFAGRMTTPDPYGGSMSITNPQSFDRYSYVHNDPVNFIDPSGLCLLVIEYTGGIETPVTILDMYLILCDDPHKMAGPGGGGDGRGGAIGGAQQKKGSGFVKPSKEDCAAKAQEIERLFQKLEDKARDLRNDIKDLRGLEGPGDPRQVQTHINNFKTIQESLQKALDYYDKHCKGKGSPPPSLERARELTRQNVPTRTRPPHGPLERGDSPWLWAIPPVLVLLGCIVCPECCVAASPVLAIP